MEGLMLSELLPVMFVTGWFANGFMTCPTINTTEDLAILSCKLGRQCIVKSKNDVCLSKEHFCSSAFSPWRLPSARICICLGICICLCHRLCLCYRHRQEHFCAIASVSPWRLRLPPARNPPFAGSNPVPAPCRVLHTTSSRPKSTHYSLSGAVQPPRSSQTDRSVLWQSSSSALLPLLFKLPHAVSHIFTFNEIKD